MTSDSTLQAELDTLMQLMIQELRALNIPISPHILPSVAINKRAKRRLGCCKRLGERFTIEVSATLLTDEPRLRQTLAHELLHTCPGCQNHGERWKAYAAIVNAAWGMEISRLAPPNEDEPARLRHDAVKYLLTCERCGKQFPRTRMCPPVQHPERYRCPCGGRLRRSEASRDEKT